MLGLAVDTSNTPLEYHNAYDVQYSSVADCPGINRLAQVVSNQLSSLLHESDLSEFNIELSLLGFQTQIELKAINSMRPGKLKY